MRKKLRRRLIDEEVGDEMYMPTDSIGIPIIVNIVLIFGYVFLGALVRLQDSANIYTGPSS